MASVNVALVRCTIPTLNPDTDAVTSQFVYAQDGGNTGDLVAHIAGFYNTAGAGATQALCHYLSPIFDGGTNHGVIEVYDLTSHLDGSPMGSPVDGGNFTLTGPGSSTMVPEGVSACVSWRAAYGTDVEYGPHVRPRARDRNRRYLGPLNSSALSAVFSGSNRVTLFPQFMTDALANTKQVEVITSTGFGTGFGPDQWNLQVWSPTAGTVKPVYEYWIDDRPDYQRRRSDQPGIKNFLMA